MQLYPMNISKFTGNISKFTCNFTSETDQIRYRGGPWGGLPPLHEPLPDCIVAPRNQGLSVIQLVAMKYRPVRPVRLRRPPEGNKTATPLRLSIFFPTFLGEDSRYQSFITFGYFLHEYMLFFQMMSSGGIR